MNKKKFRPSESIFDPGDEPHGLSIELQPKAYDQLKLTRLPSFRAILAHKTEVIVRAYGGLEQAAAALSCCRQRLSAWMSWRETPARHNLILLDNVYADAIDLLAAKKAKRVRKPSKPAVPEVPELPFKPVEVDTFAPSLDTVAPC